MLTLIGYLKRPEGVSREEFQTWWKEKHVPFVKQLPGLRRYVIHVAHKGFSPMAATEAEMLNDDPPLDGIAEIWFDDEDAVLKALISQQGAADKASFVAHVAQSVGIVARPIVVVPGPNDACGDK